MLDATAVLQAYSRLVIDCNRDPGHPTSIPTISEVDGDPRQQRTSARPTAARGGEAIFDPYHAALAGLIERASAAGRRTVLVAMHSFTPVFKGVARSVEIGVLYHRDTRLAQIMLDLLRAEGDLAVGDNEPYAITDDSDYTVPVHGEGRGLLHVEIEIRQDLIADAAGSNCMGGAHGLAVAGGRQKAARVWKCLTSYTRANIGSEPHGKRSSAPRPGTS